MESPLSDDEKRALLAEAIKTSNVDPEALAGFVRANCPTYDILSAQLPNGRSLLQCTQALERMLEPESDNSLRHVGQMSTGPMLSDTLSTYDIELHPPGIDFFRAPAFELAHLHPSSSANNPVRGKKRAPPLQLDSRSTSNSIRHFALKSPTQSPWPGTEFPTESSDRDRLRKPPSERPPHLVAQALRSPLFSLDSTSLPVTRAQLADQFRGWTDKLDPPSKSQSAGKPSRDGEKDKADIEDADHFPPDVQISSGSESSSSGTSARPTRISTTDDICNAVLKEAFSTSLDELDTPTEVWECIYHCIDEISHIIGCHEHYTAQNGPSQPAGSGSTLLGNSSKHRPAKRRRRELGAPEGTGGGDEEDDVEKNSQDANPNELSAKEIHLPCPFRKRNPLRFNVRSHQICATQTFPSISQVKRHVQNYHHRRKKTPVVTCARCGEGFPTQADLDRHLRAESGAICLVRTGGILERASDPEDGISSELFDRLRDRKAKRQVMEWEVLWKVLFPGDKTVPSEEFDPVIELDEVAAIFHTEFGTLPPQVGRELQTTIEVSWGMPAAAALAAVACHAFKGFFAGTIQTSKITFGSVFQKQQRNTRSTGATMVPCPRAPRRKQQRGSQAALPSRSPQASPAPDSCGLKPKSAPSTSGTLSPLPARTSRTDKINHIRDGAGAPSGISDGHVPGMDPFQNPADQSMCPECFQPEGTPCDCFRISGFGPPTFDPSVLNGAFTSN